MGKGYKSFWANPFSKTLKKYSFWLLVDYPPTMSALNLVSENVLYI